MAKPGLLEHGKFRRLCHLLSLPTPHALGHLELMWHRTYSRASPRLGDALDVELAADWSGEPGVLAAALAECGFVDVDAEGCHTVHDWLEHAPEYTKKRVARVEAAIARRAEELAARFPPDGGHVADSVRHMADNGSQCPPDGEKRPPVSGSTAPLLYTAPLSAQSRVRGSGGKGENAPPNPPSGGECDGFEEFWRAYPKKTGKDAARRAWSKRRPGKALAERIVAAVEAQRDWPQWQREGGRFVPNPATWLNQGRWEDERPDGGDERTRGLLDSLDSEDSPESEEGGGP